MCAVLFVEQMSYKTLQRTSSDTHTKKSKVYSNVWSDSLNVTTCCCGFIYHSANISRNYWHINGHTPYRLPCCVPGHSTQLHNLLCSWTHSQGMCWSQCMIQNSSKSRVVRFISWSMQLPICNSANCNIANLQLSYRPFNQALRFRFHQVHFLVTWKSTRVNIDNLNVMLIIYISTHLIIGYYSP